MKNNQLFRIGDLAQKANITPRTVRYYENLGLLKTKNQRTEGGQRVYTEQDLLYLLRILQLKKYGLTLEEISAIIHLGEADYTGEKRRLELIKKYKKLIEQQEKKQKDIENLILQLRQNVKQLEKSENSFTSCPGETCKTCEIKDTCQLAKIFQENR